MMVDCRGLIEFCRAFDHHRLIDEGGQSRRKSKSLNPLSHTFCNHSPFSAIDLVMLLLVLDALGVLTIPYLKFIYYEANQILPAAIDVMGDVLHQAPVAYASGFIFMSANVFVAWEFFNYQARKCGNPDCKGLRKAVKFDIQLEFEECVRHLPPVPMDTFGVCPLELGEDREELEAELKKMASVNGHTILIFCAPCGCPAERMEVWRPKKVRRIKK